MNVPTDGTMHLYQVSITTPSDVDTVVAYGRSNPDLVPVPYGELGPALLQVFGDEVIGYELADGILHVMVAEMPPQEDLEVAIDQLFEGLAHAAGRY